MTGPTTKSKWPQTVIHCIDDIIRDHRDEAALSDNIGNNLSYREIGEKVNAIADEDQLSI